MGRAGNYNQGDNLLEPKFKRVPYNGMVYIPAGEFIMGSDEQNSPDGPSTKLELGAYYIDDTKLLWLNMLLL